ncbi:chlorophyll A-B binding protein [Aureococcus anophagefferens]|nr:chlorophyll A-B binding protein [Aureococcus anophagefferens]KAH8057696.1 chlorophyll A-B binding protein [Aureococcus anophagefferens]
MARKIVALSLLASSASALVAPAAPAASSTALRADAKALVPDGIQAPTGYFDPMGIADKVNDKTLLWFRAAEIKHGRVAMAAFLGCVVTGVGAHFPGAVDLDGTSFASLADGDLFAAWDKMPADGKQQIVAAIGGIESVFEAQKPHYLQGGTPGKVRLTGTTAGVLEAKYDAEKLASSRAPCPR